MALCVAQGVALAVDRVSHQAERERWRLVRLVHPLRHPGVTAYRDRLSKRSIDTAHRQHPATWLIEGNQRDERTTQSARPRIHAETGRIFECVLRDAYRVSTGHIAAGSSGDA